MRNLNHAASITIPALHDLEDVAPYARRKRDTPAGARRKWSGSFDAMLLIIRSRAEGCSFVAARQSTQERGATNWQLGWQATTGARLGC
jgi:hypothetical protein